MENGGKGCHTWTENSRRQTFLFFILFQLKIVAKVVYNWSCFHSMFSFIMCVKLKNLNVCTCTYISNLWCDFLCFNYALSSSQTLSTVINVFPYNFIGGNLNIRTPIFWFLGQTERAKLFRREDRICATDLWNDWIH